jgi:hypothetical protein
LLREWSEIVATINSLSAAPVLPHLQQFQSDFDELAKCVAAICDANVHYRDSLLVTANSINFQITTASRHVHEVLAGESQHGFTERELARLKRQIASLSRDLHEMLPTSVTTTPEMTRIRLQMKAACGDIVALLDAAFFFRRRARNLLAEMAILHHEICALLDDMGIRYQINVAPIVVYERHEEEAPKIEETPDQRVESFVNDVSETLNLDTAHINSPIEKLDLVERTLKRVLVARAVRAPSIEVPAPVAVKRRRPPASVLQEAKGSRTPTPVSTVTRGKKAGRNRLGITRHPNSPRESPTVSHYPSRRSPLAWMQDALPSPPQDQVASSQPDEEVALSQLDDDVLLSQLIEAVTSSQTQEELVSAETEDVAAMASQEEAPPQSEGD